MLKLTFETANFGTSAALLEGENILCARAWQDPYGQAAFLVPALKEMVEDAGFTLSQVHEVVTTLGPGSFTGQRLGLCIAQTLAFAGGLCVWGVSSFQWMAAGYKRVFPGLNQSLLVCLKTGRADLFCQLFDKDVRPLKEAACLLPQDLTTYAPKEALFLAQDPTHLPEHLPTVSFNPHAVDLAFIAKPATLTLAPFYLRAVEATPHKS